ncbi:hypothetical protein QPL90_25495, partial [Pseudomonas syringae pv. syringae]|uniref:hypothetical protein n=1 Tax=Pseudomonas syringae TaxID=317 RepID=UPI002E7B4BFC
GHAPVKEVPGLYFFLSHTQIFKERSNQRLEINIHAPLVLQGGMLISKLSNRSSKWWSQAGSNR